MMEFVHLSGSHEPLLDVWVPRDGGFVAWTVLIAACISNGVTMGFVYSSSVIYSALLDYNVNRGVNDLEWKISLVVSLSTGTLFFMAPLGGICVNLIGFPKTAFLGAMITVSSLVATSFLLHSIPGMYGTMVLFGIGASIVEVTSISVLALHFHRRLGLVNGLVTSSSSLFASIFPHIMKWLLLKIGLSGLLCIFSGLLMFAGIIAFSAYKVPTEALYLQSEGFYLLNRTLWNNKRYMIWCCTLAIIWFGYFIPFVHILKYTLLKFPSHDGYIISMCLNLPAIFSRVIFGIISDHKGVNKLVLQLCTFLALGVFTTLVTVVDTWYLLITVTVCISALGGGASCLLGPIATQLCGITGAPQAIGFMFCFGSIPLIAGPSVAGLLYGRTGSYQTSFYMSGVIIVLGSILMSTIRCTKSTVNGR